MHQHALLECKYGIPAGAVKFVLLDGIAGVLPGELALQLHAHHGNAIDEQHDIISSIFNKTDLAAVNSLLVNTGDSWDSLQQSITESGGAAQQMADTQLDNLSGQITILKSALEGLAISFGEILMPKIRAAAKKIQEFVDKLNGMNDEQKETVVKIAAVVAAIGPMLILFGKVTSTVGTAMKGFSGLTKGIAKLGVKIAGSSGSITGLGSALGAVAGPVLAVVAVIGTLAAAFATLWKTNDEFRDNIIGTSAASARASLTG